MDIFIKARLATNPRYYSGDIYIKKDKVCYFRQGHDCNHTIVGFPSEEFEIYMKIEEFREKMMENT